MTPDHGTGHCARVLTLNKDVPLAHGTRCDGAVPRYQVRKTRSAGRQS